VKYIEIVRDRELKMKSLNYEPCDKIKVQLFSEEGQIDKRM
jgi:hypothetical protein